MWRGADRVAASWRGGRARRVRGRARVGQGHCEELLNPVPLTPSSPAQRLAHPAPAPCVQPRARQLFCTVRCLRRQPSLSTVFLASLGLHPDEGEEKAIATVFPTTQEHRSMRYRCPRVTVPPLAGASRFLSPSRTSSRPMGKPRQTRNRYMPLSMSTGFPNIGPAFVLPPPAQWSWPSRNRG